MIVRPAAPGFEVLMLRRSRASAFVPDAYVFPGGAVDPGDTALGERALGFAATRAEPAFLAAALRECYEEAGIVLAARADETPLDTAPEHWNRLRRDGVPYAQALADTGAVPDARDVAAFSRWVTPPGETRRYDTVFFLARAPLGQVARADATETTDVVWIAPRAALEAHANGTFPMIFPTIKHLERLAAFAEIDALAAFARTKPIRIVHAIPGPPFDIPRDLGEDW